MPGAGRACQVTGKPFAILDIALRSNRRFFSARGILHTRKEVNVASSRQFSGAVNCSDAPCVVEYEKRGKGYQARDTDGQR